MIRSKNCRTVRSRCRCVSADLDVVAADVADCGDAGFGDNPAGELTQRAALSLR
jgi:hypothetical protein